MSSIKVPPLGESIVEATISRWLKQEGDRVAAGDTLYADVYVDDVRQAHGTDIIVNKVVITNQDGEIVQENYTTLAGRSEDDGESGFNDGTA